MSIAFADFAEAAAAHVLPALLYVRIGGVAVDATDARVTQDVDQPVGTCTVYVRAPRPASATLNASIEIEMGYPGAVARVFHGRIPSDESVSDDGGNSVRIDGVDDASLMVDAEFTGVELAGPVSLKDANRSLWDLRNITAYLSDDTTAVDGLTTIMLGGNPDINAGNIRIDTTTGLLDWQNRINELFGYRVFGSSDGSLRCARISGLARPQLADPVATTDLSMLDYVQPRVGLNFREGPGTSTTAIGSVGPDDVGRVISSDVVSADGLLWMQMTFPGQPAGWCALTSVGAGTPLFSRLTPDTVPPVYAYGDNCFRITYERDTRPMANYIEVLGARYTAADGGSTAIRAIPDEVPFAPELAPRGWRPYTVSSQEIVTDQQAQWVRTATEVDRAAPYERVSWDTWGRSDLQPGDVVTLHAPTNHGITYEDFWVLGITRSYGDDGYLMTVTGWRGAGRALKAGNDCRTEIVPGDTVIHAGTQTISYYRDPSPDSVRDPNETDKDVKDRRWVVEIPITVTDADYSSLRLLGQAHGTNSIKNTTAITGSCVEIWQLEDPSKPEGGENEMKRVGSVDLPTLNEESSKRRNYASSDTYWTNISLPLPGSLKEGAAKLVIVSGSSDGDDADDFELKDLQIRYCGVGLPQFAGSIQ